MANSTMRQVTADFLLADQIVVGVLFCILGFNLVFVESWALIETLLDKHGNRDSLILQLLIYFQLLFTLGMLIAMGLTVYLVPFPTTVLICDVAVKFLVSMYICSVLMCYGFMIKKSSIVSGFEKGKLYTRVSFFTKWTLILLVPTVMLPLVNIFDNEYINREGICLVMDYQTWFPAAFGVANVFLSGILLYLFIAPLRSLLKSSDAHSNSVANKQIARVVRVNSWIALFMVTVTSLNTFIGAAMWAYGQDPEQDYLLLYTVLGPSLDCFSLCIGCRLMTNLWIPKPCRRANKRKQTSEGRIINSGPDNETKNPAWVTSTSSPKSVQLIAKVSSGNESMISPDRLL